MLNPDPQPVSDAGGDVEGAPSRTAASRPSGWWLVTKTVISAALAVAIVSGGVFVMQQLIAARPEVPQRPATERQIAVLTQQVVETTHSPTITVFGEVVAGRLVDLRALVAGEITAANPDVEAGRRIEAGDSLVEIDRFAYEGAVVEAEANLAEAVARLAEAEARLGLEQGQLAGAEDQLALAERDLERAEQLAGTGDLTDRALDDRRLIVSQRSQTVDQRRANLAIEEARLDQQRAAIQRLEWRLAQARRDLERTVLLAPFSGVIRSESVEPGRLVSVNDVLATLYDDSALNVRFTLSDSQFGRLAGEDAALVGRPITVTWSTGGQDVTLPGTIDRLDADIAAASGGVTLFGRVDHGAAPAALRPGAFVSVAMADRAFDGTVRVPETAIYNSDHLFTVVDDRLLRRPVDLVAWDGAFALVRATDGTSLDGAEVVTSRMTDAGDGVAIRRIEPAR